MEIACEDGMSESRVGAFVDRRHSPIQELIDHGAPEAEGLPAPAELRFLRTKTRKECVSLIGHVLNEVRLCITVLPAAVTPRA